MEDSATYTLNLLCSSGAIYPPLIPQQDNGNISLGAHTGKEYRQQIPLRCMTSACLLTATFTEPPLGLTEKLIIFIILLGILHIKENLYKLKTFIQLYMHVIYDPILLVSLFKC